MFLDFSPCCSDETQKFIVNNQKNVNNIKLLWSSATSIKESLTRKYQQLDYLISYAI